METGRIKMNNEQIEIILAKMATGEASRAELDSIEFWRGQSDENQSIYNEYVDAWDLSSSYTHNDFTPNFEAALARHLDILSAESVIAPAHTDVNIESSASTQQTAVVRRFSFVKYASIAAVFLVALSAVFLMRGDQESYTSTNGVQFVSLSDGSKVWLQEGSSIIIDKDFGGDTRNVELEGKAFFDVARDENSPFIIKEGGIVVSVLGTSFTVDGNNNEVDVTTGTVKVANADNSVVIQKDQRVLLVDGQLNVGASVTGSALWRNPLLSFSNSSLSQVVADINLHYGDKLELASVADLDCPFTSSGLANEGLENTLEILRTAYDLEIETRGDIYILTISSCL